MPLEEMTHNVPPGMYASGAYEIPETTRAPSACHHSRLALIQSPKNNELFKKLQTLLEKERNTFYKKV